MRGLERAVPGPKPAAAAAGVHAASGKIPFHCLPVNPIPTGSASVTSAKPPTPILRARD
jgi:hypothetical protein